ncbi:glycoside hydrolase family 3 protein [Phytoactinopolyspora endophytica]|uniref:glycoside hydrolase family 3 protein n=1 Tax=Phytoactinopolyspora endophytica TaxID=1642495 RepID=UPI00197C24D5|nr:glycoside hydrolase family 3 C-terminal domain-containing protein [Phytoactinopolyspora endophytica]
MARRPPTNAADGAGGVDLDEHHDLARRLAADCAVLLKNDGPVLPLESAGTLAVIGHFAEAPRFQGGGSSHINAHQTDSALDAMRVLAAEHGQTLRYAPGFALEERSDSAALRAEVVRAAEDADVAVVFVGLADHDESEGFDREHLDLPSAQVELIREVATVAALALVASLQRWSGTSEADDSDQGQDVLNLIGSMPMRTFRNFPGVNVPTETLEQLMAASNDGSRGVAANSA